MSESAPEMEDIRRRIKAALERSPDKSQKELAKLLNISPQQVTSLLTPGGRWLQVPEVPIVERYLEITLLKRPRFRSRQDRLKLPPKFAPSLPTEFTPEGLHVVLEETHPDIARYLKSVVAERPAEIWRITTDLVQEAGYLPGDFVVIDRAQPATAGDVVLADVRAQAGAWVPIFRVLRPPSLRTANSKYEQARLPIADAAIAVIGPICASVRDSRSPKQPRGSREGGGGD